GQPELDRKLEHESIRQLNQRITFHYQLEGLGRRESASYLRHRLKVAGARRELFSPSALSTLYESSGGVPRLLNILAHKSLMLGFGEGSGIVKRRHVRAAVRDTPAAPGRNSDRRLAWLSLALFAV